MHAVVDFLHLVDFKMGMWQFQSNMNRGELDPRLLGRIDIQAYYNGVRTCSNALTIPQGGAKRRPGQDFLGPALGNGRFENFSFNTEQNYLLVFTDLKMQVYKDGILQANLNGSGNDFIVTPWTFAQLQDLDYIQSADTAIITHENHAPQAVTRTSDTTWDIDALPLVNIPQFQYDPAPSPQLIVETQDITFTSPTEGDRYRIALEGILSDDIVFAGDDAANIIAIKDAILSLGNTGNTGIDVAATTPLLVYRVIFSGDSSDAWELLTITPVVSAITTFKGEVTRITTGESLKEDVWSVTKGWPRTCTFHEGRLFFGGSLNRPQTIWGSRVNDFFNFDEGRARDDNAVIATLDTDQLNAITSIFSNRSLQVFTTGAEFYVPQGRGEPITPANISVAPQTNLGSKRVRPISIDGVTLYLQRTGKVLNQFVFVNEFQSNQSGSVSSLAPHLIKNPIKMAASRGTEDTDANYVYVLNTDGSLTVFNTLASEGVQAFSSWDSGIIKSITVVSDRLYLLIEREINSSTVYYIEKEALVAKTDSAIISNVAGSDTLTGLSHLEGEQVEVKADGAYQGVFTVTGGEITITREAQEIEAGLFYTPTIRTMPLNVGMQNGPNAASKKKILKAAVNFYESNGILVNGQRLADKTIGVDQFDAPTPQTGLKRISLLGWSLEADITITQSTPFDMTILSIGMEIKT